MKKDGISGKLKGLNPAKVFEYFEELSAIPRDSRHEDAIASYLCSFAERKGLRYRTDAMHNVLIHKNASAGYEREPEIMLQGHTDMVCAKNENSAHDFRRDPLKLYIENGWIRAKDTTLGADDGIAVAVMLALLDDKSAEHPPLSCLFTAAEEIGLLGAAAFDYSGIDAQILINLDSEDEGIACVSCAGGIRGDIDRKIERRPAEENECFCRLKWDGFLGGHSGIDINSGRTNAIRAMARILCEPLNAGKLSVVSIDGGMLDNAIPRSCEAVISCKAAELDLLKDCLCRSADRMKTEFSDADCTAALTVSETAPEAVMQKDDAQSILTLLCDIPDGVLRMSDAIEGLVQTSANLGVVRTFPNRIKISVLARSAEEHEQEELMHNIGEWAESLCAVMTLSGEYPGWPYRENSSVRNRYCRVYRRLFGQEPKIEAIHAGLECGRIVHEMPQIDAISIGPTMKNVHTTEEALEIASVQKLWLTLLEILRERD